MRKTLAATLTLTVLSWSHVHADLIALYSFDNAANPMEDSSGQGNHIASTGGPGGPIWGAGFGFQASGAYQFGGDGDRLVVPIDINPVALPQMTWGAWVRTNDLSLGLRKVMGHDNGGWDRTIGLDTRDDNILRYTSFNGGAAPWPRVTLSGPANTTDWAFLAASYDHLAGRMTVYLDIDASTDEDLLEVASANATFSTGETSFSIGSISPVNNTEGWSGAIDQVFVYDEILDLAKMSDIRRRGLNELLGIPEGDPELSASLSTLFGNLTGLGAGPGAISQTVRITNSGVTQDLNLTGISITGPDAGLYVPTPPASTTIPPAGEVELEITFTPPVEGGSFQASLEITSNDEVSPLFAIPLDATVTTDPNMEVIAPTPVFGRITINEIPAVITRNIVVRNTGVVNTLNLDPPTVTGANQSSYDLNISSLAIAPGEEAVIEVSLNPAGMAGGFSANILVTSDDPDSTGFSAALSANLVIVAPASLLAFYCFDNESDPFEDLSGNGTHITTAAGPGTQVWGADLGFAGSGGYEFTGDGSRLIAPIDINPGVLPQMTWGAWLRTNSLAVGRRKALGHDDGVFDRVIGFDERNNGVFRYTSFTGMDPPLLGTPSPVSTTDWTFMAATYDQSSGLVTVYVDLDATTTEDLPVAVTGPTVFGSGLTEISIGSLRPDNNAEGWNGAIDNVFVYEGILTTDQVWALRDMGKAAVLGPVEGPRLAVTQSGDNLLFTWDSLGGKLYNLRSETDPSAAEPGDWPIYDGNADIGATPPENSLTIPRPADPFRLFVVEEFDAPPVAVFSEDFESGQGMWTVGSDGDPGTDWQLGTPSLVGPAAANSPVNCFATNIDADYGFDANIWLRSPAIDLTTAGGATLRFFQYVDNEPGFDRGTVSVLDAADDSFLAMVESPIEGFAVDWHEFSKALPAAALGKSIKIEFRFTSEDVDNYAGWYIDDVVVTVP